MQSSYSSVFFNVCWLLIVSCLFFFIAFPHFFEFSLRLNDEAKHLALCRSDHFSCSLERVHVPEAYVSVRVVTMLDR